MTRSSRSTLLLATTTGVAGVVLAGCGTDAEPGSATPTASASPTQAPSQTPPPGATATPEQTSQIDPDAVTIKMTVRGDSIKPGPRVIKVKRDKPVVFLIDSDRPGGLHVHSSPEQSPEFKAGKSTITLTLDKPGVVEVEEHEADALVAQLEVR